MRLPKLTAVIAAVGISSFAAAVSVAQARAATVVKTYNVAFSVVSGHYDFHGCVDPSCAQSDGAVVKLDGGPIGYYSGLKIPAKGTVPALKKKGTSLLLPSEGSWRRYGSGYDQSGHPAQYDCHGGLASTSGEELWTTGTTRRNLNLHVQISHFELSVTNPAGSDNVYPMSATGGCSFYNGSQAFDPVDAMASDGGVRMLTAHVLVPLRELRNLKKGGDLSVNVDEGMADFLPPRNCDGAGNSGLGLSYLTCSDHWSWDGKLVFRRTR